MPAEQLHVASILNRLLSSWGVDLFEDSRRAARFAAAVPPRRPRMQDEDAPANAELV